ncbi:transposase [Anoxybacter fermentans]|uniref:transposase n=1 Tax=Anoxybacter fermentans TaxID=1323375 RepID=UPI003AB8D233
MWIPKYRRKALVDDVREFTIKTLYQIAEDKGFEILVLGVCPDHIHLFILFLFPRLLNALKVPVLIGC